MPKADRLNTTARDNLAPGEEPDAALIALCAQHIANMDTYNSTPSRLDEPWLDPLWIAYERTRDAITEARPQTPAGLRAVARAALAEASQTDGETELDGTPGGRWAVTVLRTLLGGVAA